MSTELERLRWAPRHTPEELAAVVADAQAGHEKAKHALVTMVRPFVVALVREWDGTLTRDQSDDLKGAVWLAVFEALETFDPEAGTRFTTWAHYRMRRAAQDWVRLNVGAVALPDRQWRNAIEARDRWEEANPSKAATEASSTELKAAGAPGRDPAAALAAKRSAAEIDPSDETQEALARSHRSAEADYFETEHDIDTDALVTVEKMRASTDEAERAALAFDFVARHDLPEEVAHRMLAVCEERNRRMNGI